MCYRFERGRSKCEKDTEEDINRPSNGNNTILNVLDNIYLF